MEELISKKELLETTQISYGQLYRWKRKHIIPEEWFIKKAVPSGQETFFPREKILQRIEVIINMKDEASLDDLARMFNPDTDEAFIDIVQLAEVGIVSEASIILYQQIAGKNSVIQMEHVIGMKLLKEHVMPGDITLDEGKMLIRFIEEHLQILTKPEASVYLVRHMGLPFVVGTKDREMIVWDTSYKVLLTLNVYEEISAIKFGMRR